MILVFLKSQCSDLSKNVYFYPLRTYSMRVMMLSSKTCCDVPNLSDPPPQKKNKNEGIVSKTVTLIHRILFRVYTNWISNMVKLAYVTGYLRVWNQPDCKLSFVGLLHFLAKLFKLANFFGTPGSTWYDLSIFFITFFNSSFSPESCNLIGQHQWSKRVRATWQTSNRKLLSDGYTLTNHRSIPSIKEEIYTPPYVMESCSKWALNNEQWTCFNIFLMVLLRLQSQPRSQSHYVF